MGRHTIPYIGEAVFTRLDYVSLGFALGYPLIILYMRLIVGWETPVVFGLATCTATVLMVLIATSRQAVAEPTGKYRFDP